MHENQLLFKHVPPGHPGENRQVGPGNDAGTAPFRRATAEAELLRARLRQGESVAAADFGADQFWASAFIVGLVTLAT
jgi:hypothetical protein